ncbi:MULTISPECIES: hypothetical protein [unclassified Streptomyces]|uniref:hypothetical protein n=1 Tax=unclassified Streptomyces TaxID=2593676 RepID=UPI003818E6A3
MHEPNDVTVELDGLGRQLSELPAGARPGAASAAVREAGPEGSEGPVFVDETGRRSRKLRRAGWVVALACACYAVTVVAALIGGDSNAPWLPIPGLADKRKTDTVEIQPAATVSEGPSESPEPTAEPTATETDEVVPRSTGAVATGATGLPVLVVPVPEIPPEAPAVADPDPAPVIPTDPGVDPGVDPGGTGAPPTETETPTEPTEPTAPTSVEPSPPAESPMDPVVGQPWPWPWPWKAQAE